MAKEFIGWILCELNTNPFPVFYNKGNKIFIYDHDIVNGLSEHTLSDVSGCCRLALFPRLEGVPSPEDF